MYKKKAKFDRQFQQFCQSFLGSMLKNSLYPQNNKLMRDSTILNDIVIDFAMFES